MSRNDKPKIAIVDYRMSNLFSVKHVCDYFSLNSIITSDKKEILAADAVILPGVGAFGVAMENLAALDLIAPIKDFTASGKPLMGICLGQQLLFTESEEFGRHKGLDLIRGNVVRFSNQKSNGRKIKVPHVGWSQMFKSENINLWDNSPLRDISEGRYVYYIHSYYVVPENSATTLAVSHYEGTEFCSSVMNDNIFAMQFHPEKSAHEGIQIFRNWIQHYNLGDDNE